MDRYLLKVSAVIRGNDSGKQTNGCSVFTGKLVKSLIIDANPALKRFFEKASGSSPKLIHVTPLYVESGKVRCVHSLNSVNGRGRYTFYVGFIESEIADSPSFDSIYNAVLDISGRHRFKDRILDVELLSVELVNVNDNARIIVSSLAKTGKLRVVFASPTLLRDPLRAGKHKSLTPTPMNIFSTPVYVNLYLSGRLRQKSFIRTLVMLHRLLNEPYSIHRTAKVVKIRYDGGKNPIPALIGYVNLFLNRGYYEQYTARGINIESLLQETLATMLAIGTGTSRATGFGHIALATTSGTSYGSLSFPEPGHKDFKPPRTKQPHEAIKKD